MQRISPFLWFDSQAEEAAKYYVGIFRNSKILNTSRYGEAGKEIHGRKPGSVMTVDFELDGVHFTALNGGPHFRFNEAVSFTVHCADQKEVDYYWEKLTAGGDPKAQQCGWLKDKFGLSWQVTPTKIMEEMMAQPGPAAERAFGAMMQMKKFDIAALRRAYDGE